ncbi:MAG: argininosuccinate synthase [Deltaproteobacteria bacterium]|nr:argininosuccinate synthase [Deltaproteobacteria bacterium]
MKPSKTVVLVYSGGLDTSVCIPFVKEEYGYERVVTVTVDVGQPAEDIREAAEKAKAMGTEHYTVDAKEEFAKDFCFNAVKANAMYEGYPLSTSIARPIIAAKAVEVAKKLGATAFAHGCTGKGNDQFRIEFAIRALMPEAIIHAPIREKNMTRSWEIEYALSKGVPIKQSLAKIWSIDENLWGRSIEGGRLEEPDFAPPEEIFQWTKSPTAAVDKVTELKVAFEGGAPVALNGEKLSPAKLIAAANVLAGENAIGRIDVMEDRMLGLKVRENYECPGSMLLLTAHKALEALVLTRDELRFKTQIDAEWSKLAYEGLWWDPFKEGLEAFIGSTQKRVSGTVTMRLYKGSMTTIGRSSPWALYNEDLASFDTKTFEQNESTGWVKNFGLQSRMYHSLVAKMGAKKGPDA